MREQRHSRITAFRADADMSKGQHIAVRPISWLYVLVPGDDRGNWFFRSTQRSQKSPEIRHICAYFEKTSTLAASRVPGDRLNTIGRPYFLIEALRASISEL